MRHPFAVYFVARALVLRNRGSYEGAAAYVRRAFGVYGADAPSIRAPVILNALYADLCLATDARVAAYDAARAVLIQINEIADGVGWGWPNKAEDKWFLLYWMRYVLSRLSPYVDSGAWELALAIPANYSSLDLPNTSSFLKGTFPFEQHWALELDLAVEQARKDASA